MEGHRKGECFGYPLVPPVTILPGATVDPAPEGSFSKDKSISRLERSLKTYMEEKISKDLCTYPVVLTGSHPAERIIQFAGEERIDLIVIASHGQSGWKRHVFGSVPQKVLREASCSVLLVRPHTDLKVLDKERSL